MTKEQTTELKRLHLVAVDAATRLASYQRERDQASAVFHDYLDSVQEPEPTKRKYVRKAKPAAAAMLPGVEG